MALLAVKSIKGVREIRKISKQITLKKGIFNTMLSSCMEVYPYEAYGLIFGKFKKQREGEEVRFIYLVESCVPLQDTEKTYTEIYFSEKSTEVIKQISEQNRLNFLGDYHSHTRYQKQMALAELSKVDKQDFYQNKDLVSIVLAVNKLKYKRKGKNVLENVLFENQIQKKISVFYSIHKNGEQYYKIDFCAYSYDPTTHKIGQISIRIVD